MKEGSWEQSAWIVLVVAVLLRVAPFPQNRLAEKGEEVVCTCVPLVESLAKSKNISFHPEVLQDYMSGGCKASSGPNLLCLLADHGPVGLGIPRQSTHANY